MDFSPPGSSVHGILQASLLEWEAIPFPRESSLPRDWNWVSCIAGRLFTVWGTREAKLWHKWNKNRTMKWMKHSLLSEAPGKLNYDTNETKTMTKQKQTWENIENSLVIAKVRERWAGTFRLAGTNYIDRMDNNKVLLYSTGDYIQ